MYMQVHVGAKLISLVKFVDAVLVGTYIYMYCVNEIDNLA